MKISVITPVLNRVETIADALQSVSAQDYGNIEHIIQDGGSDDGTVDCLRDWRGQIPLHWQSCADRGLYDAINKGMARSTGDVIGLMHSDDVLADRAVLSDVAQALSGSGYDGVYGDLDMVTATGQVLRHWRAGAFHRDRLRRGWVPPHPTLYLRRDVLERFGAYDPDYRIAGDYDAMLRWIWTGQVRLAYLPRVLVKMRVGGASTGSVAGLLTKSKEDYRALRRNGVGGVATLAAKNLRKLGQFSAVFQMRPH